MVVYALESLQPGAVLATDQGIIIAEDRGSIVLLSHFPGRPTGWRPVKILTPQPVKLA